MRVGVGVVHNGRSMKESVASDAFLPSAKPAPVLLSHDKDKVVGEVVGRIAHRDWHLADFVLDPSAKYAPVAYDLLKTGTRISPGFTTLRNDAHLEQSGLPAPHTRATR